MRLLVVLQSGSPLDATLDEFSLQEPPLWPLVYSWVYLINTLPLQLIYTFNWNCTLLIYCTRVGGVIHLIGFFCGSSVDHYCVIHLAVIIFALREQRISYSSARAFYDPFTSAEPTRLRRPSELCQWLANKVRLPFDYSDCLSLSS